MSYLNNRIDYSLILIDTNIFVIDPRCKRDVCYKTNRRFLDYMAEKRTGFTTIVNLLELCWGILSGITFCRGINYTFPGFFPRGLSRDLISKQATISVNLY